MAPCRNDIFGAASCRDTVRRVVLTSSVAAIRSGKSPATPANPPLYSEKDWNEAATLETEPYPYSKVHAACRLDCAWCTMSADNVVRLSRPE